MPRLMKIILATSLVAQVSMAQTTATPPPSAPVAPAAPGTTAPPQGQVDISVPQRSTLSPQEMLTQARDYRAKMNEVVTRIQSLVEQSRRSKDVIRLNCLLDKLAQLRANLNIADQALQSLQDATARRDDGGSVHEFTRITIVNQKVQVLGAESEACVGEDLSFVGATRVDVEAPNLPGFTNTPPPPPGTLERPPVDRPPTASSFR